MRHNLKLEGQKAQPVVMVYQSWGHLEYGPAQAYLGRQTTFTVTTSRSE
jgi:hypothetical protein